MNIDKLKAYSWIPASVIACWLLWDKVDIPDTYEPASVQYVNDKVSPIDGLALKSAKKGISWGLDKVNNPDPRFPAEYIHQELCGNLLMNTEGDYRIYQRITGAKHPTEKELCK